MKKLLLFAFCLFIGLSSCSLSGIVGSGNVVSKTYAETGFKDIEVSSVMKVYLTQGNEYSIKIDAEDNILEQMTVEKKGGKLSIGFKDKLNLNLNPTKDIAIYITAPEFHDLEASGASSFSSKGLLTCNEIILDLSGASNAQLQLAVNNTKIDASGGSKIMLSGVSEQLDIEGSGSTEIEAIDLKAQSVNIDISGAGNATVSAEKQLKVSISGAANIKYKGTPSISKEISGAGSVEPY